MLKRRLTAILIVKDGIVVQSVGFAKYLPVGNPMIAAESLNRWGIDEIVLLDMSATPAGNGPDYELIKKVSKKCFVPLTVGGGVSSIDEMRKLTHYGADKAAINTAALEDPSIIEECAKVFGQQCVVVSMDVKGSNGKYEVFADSGKRATGKTPVEWAKEAESRGAGEILLNSIDRDGAKKGYDIALAGLVADAVTIPVIACGGAGHPEHFLELAVRTGASALAAGNFFNFTEHSPITVKSYLVKAGVDVRLDTYAHYRDSQLDAAGRVAKREELYLEKLKFEYHPEEVI